MTRPIANSPVRMIRRYGKDCTYLKELAGTYDPATSTVTRATGTSYVIKAYKTDVAYREGQTPNLVGKDAVVFLVAGADLAFTPELNDKISDSNDYQVMMISKVEVNDVVALWRLVCIRS